MQTLLQQRPFLNEELAALGARFALIGGMAMSAHKLPRATQDIDFLLDRHAADSVHEWLLTQGCHCLYRRSDAANDRPAAMAVDFVEPNTHHRWYQL